MRKTRGVFAAGDSEHLTNFPSSFYAKVYHNMSNWLKVDKNGVHLRVRVIPRARKNKVDGLHGNAVKIRLTAPPVEGAANDALVKFLATLLRVPRRNVQIVQGERSRDKVVYLDGVTPSQVRQALGVKEPGDISPLDASS